MKKFLCSLLSLVFLMETQAQSVSINNDGTSPHASAMLDVKSNSKGILIARTSTASRTLISSPARGLLVYDTTVNSFWFHNGNVWTEFLNESTGWKTTGNWGTDTAWNFIGTRDNRPLTFRINNQRAGILDSSSANTGFGYKVLFNNTTGALNTALGAYSLRNNLSGTGNTGIGYHAMLQNTESYNTALGYLAMEFNSIGTLNTAGGSFALRMNTAGNANTAFGASALSSNTTGNSNTAIGSSALYVNTIGVNNTAVGTNALFSNSRNNNTAYGASALFSNTDGTSNIAIGVSSLRSNNQGIHNCAIGNNALWRNTTASYNIAIGSMALNDNITGEKNVAIGPYALYPSNGNENVAIGFASLSLNGDHGNMNTAIGSQALYNSWDGYLDVAVGKNALLNNSTGYMNVAIGANALTNNTTGSNNIAIGYNSGIDPLTPYIYNTISIGNDNVLNAYQNQAIIGNIYMGWIGGQVTWHTFSDARIKNNIKDDVIGLEFIRRLRPVTYFIDTRKQLQISSNKETGDYPGKYDIEKMKFSGFPAQEVEQAAKETGYDFSGYSKPRNEHELYTLSYEAFVVPLVKAVQEQQSIIEDLKKQIELLQKAVADLQKR